MKKVAIVGVEGSGKTVMLAGLGELYSQPDANGYFLSPEDFQTSAYVHRQIARMRSGQWPGATEGDALHSLNWTLCRRDAEGNVKEGPAISFLDFAGEVYRCAFGISKVEDHPDLADAVKALKEYVLEADGVLVLVNLRDVITGGFSDLRTEEAIWISNSILKSVLDSRSGTRRLPRTAIVLSQADSYAETIKSQGGVKATLQHFLPHLANRYGKLEVLAASTVDRTEQDDAGNVVPAKDFKPAGLQPIMDWVIGNMEQFGAAEAPRGQLCRSDAERAFGEWCARNQDVVGAPGDILPCGNGGFSQWFKQQEGTNYCQRLFLSPKGICCEVHGGISRCYHQYHKIGEDYFNESLGFPISEEESYAFADGGDGWKMQRFEKGAIVWRADYWRTEVVGSGGEPSESFRHGRPVAMKSAGNDTYVSISAEDVKVPDGEDEEDVLAQRNLGAFHARQIERNGPPWENSWEKFFIVENADGTWSGLSFKTHRYVSVQDDGTLKANACEIGPREKFTGEPFNAGVKVFSVFAEAYVEAQDGLLRADCRGREPGIAEEFRIEDA